MFPDVIVEAFLGTECNQGPRVPDVMKKAIVPGVFAEAMVPDLIKKLLVPDVLFSRDHAFRGKEVMIKGVRGPWL